MTLLKYLIPALICLLIGIFATLHFGKSNPTTTVLYDTTLVTRYETKLQTDTVVKWYQKIVYKKAEPEKILVQKVDSVFIDKIQEQDVMLQVEKKGDELKIIALNQFGKTLKEYTYKDIGRDFIASSINNNISVKAKKLYWNGLNTNIDYTIPVQNKLTLKDGQYQIGLSSGITYLDKTDLNLIGKYDLTSKDIFVGLQLKVKLLK